MQMRNKIFSYLFIAFLFVSFYFTFTKESDSVELNTNVLAMNSENGSTKYLKNIAVFIRFSDSDTNVVHHLDDNESISNATKLFNSDTLIEMDSVNGKINVPSFKTYYERESYGSLSITTEIFPKENGHVVSYTDSHPIGYYLKYTDTNPIGYKDKTESLKRETELVNNAVSAISSMVASFGITADELDTDKDGKCDAISFIVEGQPNLPSAIEFNDLLWSHKLDNTGVTNKILGKNVTSYILLYASDYTASAGLFSLNRGTYGTIIHEFGHTLGFMDLYRFSDGTSKPVGFYDIMGNTIGSNPQSFLAYYMSEFRPSTNFHNPLPVITKTTKDITLYKPKFIDKNEKRAIKIEVGGNKEEFFIVEYHEKMNTYASYSADRSGIIIYRVNEKNKYLGNGTSENQGEKDHVYIFRPNETSLGAGKGDLSLATLNSKRPTFGTELDLGNKEFDNQSIFFSDGTNSGLVIEVTKETADSITFNVTYPKTEGEGTKENPYLIRDTETYLYLMGISTKDKYYKIMNDLDFTGIEYPRISFEGNLEGNNKILKNITSKKSGVFQSIGQEQTKTSIKNLMIENIHTFSNTGFTLGGFANHAVNVELYNVHIKSGNVVQEASPIYDLETTGGFIGSVDNKVQIESCSANIKVQGVQNVGGFIGLNKNAQIKNSFATGFIEGTNKTGGFIGLQLIMDSTYNIPENVYFNGNTIENAVGGYDTSFHKLDVLSEEDLAKGIRKVTVSPSLSLTQYTNKEVPIKIEPNATLSYQVTFEKQNLATYQNGKIEGLNIGTTSAMLELNIGTGKMPFSFQITIEAPSKIITESEGLNFLGLTKKEGYVIGFEVESKISSIREKIAQDKRMELKSFKNANGQEINSGIVATGMQFTLVLNKQEYTYTIIIKGDVNGDGHIYANDYVKIKNHIMGNGTITGPYLLAADIDNDKNIYATDYVHIKNYIMKDIEILQKF